MSGNAILITTIIIILVSANLSAQREAANWYFGQNAGLDFNSGTPVPLLDGQINTVEGCEAFSDANGNLLFYTDGKTVWNRSHQVMPSGTELGGSFSTTQSALVVPNPIDKNIYYVFTPDDALSKNFGQTTNGFNYSVVDMAKDNGRGDVIDKNITLLAQCSEKVSAVRNASGDYYWVVTHFRNQFYAYRVDGSGVSENPVVSTTGPWIGDFENIRGSLKISPDGTKLAVAHTIVEPEYAGSFYLFDFEVDTGVVSNAQLISSERLYYGVEFSSNSSKLYASGMGITTLDGEKVVDKVEIVQYDLDAPNIAASEYLVFRFNKAINSFVAGALQIGIDKKIYHAIPGDRLSVIRTPNLKGLDSDFRQFYIDMGGRGATYGLPPFIQSFFETIVTIENFCEGDTTQFTTESNGTIASISWDFGDPLSGASNYSNDLNPTHVFSGFGVYTVTITVEYTNGNTRAFLEYVEIAEVPDVIQNVQLVQCDIDGNEDGISLFNLNEAIPLFNNGNADITANFFGTLQDALNNENILAPIGYQNSVDGEVVFARAFENSECFEIVEVELSAQPLTDLEFYKDIDLCDGTVGILATIVNMQEVQDQLYIDFAQDDIGLYLTEDNALLEVEKLPLEERTFGPFDPLLVYFRVEQGNDCAFIGHVTLNVHEKPVFDELVEVIACNGEAVLRGMDGFENYLWPDGSTQQVYSVQGTGNVDLIFGNDSCSYLQTFSVIDEAPFTISKIIINDFRPSNEVIIETELPDNMDGVRFSMDGGLSFQESNTFSRLLPGVYDLVVSDGCTEIKKTILVGGVTSFFTPNNDGINDRWALANPEFFPGAEISIFDRYGKLLSIIRNDGPGWDGTFNRREMPSDDYWYRLRLAEGRVVTGHFTLKR
ncbi:MAG: hypothetical protein CMH48_12950 [Muricauda sp.]|nr:hypothetical protein [Allomuricauda sp.]MBC31738.1 hypothetical protein [Allomuricauda sp.]